ncbi:MULTISPECIES: hypothetical protein [Streptomyces]|uniref:hypothetical protein n=1 Tax=Streptomyces TaxID=1883 RepID=UPI0018AC94A3|nr:hypothetical protein [Streptomyces sp. BRB081]MBL3803222.1 hypothetical protein [Streptomyces sp. BRB081]
MSLRPTLRTAVLTATALGAVLLPSTAAVADSGASPVPTVDSGADTPTPAPDSRRAERAESPDAEPVPRGTVPRGGVDAGERPAESAGATALYGSAAGAVLLAGAGTLVVRRRSAAQRNG